MLNFWLMSRWAFLNTGSEAGPNSKPPSTCSVSNATNFLALFRRTNAAREALSSTNPMEVSISLARRYQALGASVRPYAVLRMRRRL